MGMLDRGKGSVETHPVRSFVRAGAGWRVPVAAVALLLGLGAADESSAGGGSIYEYMDARGVVHFSDAPVDARFRRLRRAPPQDGIAIAPRPRVRVPSESDYDRLIAHKAARYGVQPALVKAVIAAESNFQPDAVSRAGAQGMMQLMPATAAELGVEQPFGVVENIDGGVRYLRLMLDRYGDVTRALAAYNAGPGAVDRYGGVPPYAETEAYVDRVLEYYRGYWSEFARPARRPPSGQPARDSSRRPLRTVAEGSERGDGAGPARPSALAFREAR